MGLCPRTQPRPDGSTAAFTIGKNLHISGPALFKPVLFKGQSTVPTLKMKNFICPSETWEVIHDPFVWYNIWRITAVPLRVAARIK